MYEQRCHQLADRIVSLSQPYVRPIVRGKSGQEVEFGAKLSVSLVSGYTYLDRISWDAYHEGADLIRQVQNYHDRYGVYQEVVIADQIYGSHENRTFLKSKGIRFSGKPLGRPPQLSPDEKRIIRAEARLRSRILCDESGPLDAVKFFCLVFQRCFFGLLYDFKEHFTWRPVLTVKKLAFF